MTSDLSKAVWPRILARRLLLILSVPCSIGALLPSAESPCLGEVVRDVIRRQKGSASCATASKVPVMECRGGCGPQCCQPTRSKRRKYVFQCTDGSSFVEEVERHLECGCRPCS